ncbi:MAG: hypothetical protein KA190_26065 [Kofleriaceae bacterium]|nr:hypothetical protein [Kofleriaceae bacterium]
MSRIANRRASLVFALSTSASACGQWGFADVEHHSVAPDATAVDGLDTSGPDGGVAVPSDGALAAGVDATVVTPGACPAGTVDGPLGATFDAGQPAWASIYQPGTGGVAFTAGRLVLSPSAAHPAPAYWGIFPAAGATDLRGHTFSVEVPTMVDPTRSTQVLLGLASDDGWYQLYQSLGQLTCERSAAGLVVSQGVPYSPSGHRWWRLREQGGVVTCEASADGLSWTEIGANPSLPQLAAAGLELSAGLYRAEAGPLGQAAFDNLRHCIPAP